MLSILKITLVALDLGRLPLAFYCYFAPLGLTFPFWLLRKTLSAPHAKVLSWLCSVAAGIIKIVVDYQM